MIRSGTADTEEDPADERQWEDLRPPEYRAALLEHFETHRHERYPHLSEHRFTKLRTLVKDPSDISESPMTRLSRPGPPGPTLCPQRLTLVVAGSVTSDL